jgi:hypothetical protein
MSLTKSITKPFSGLVPPSKKIGTTIITGTGFDAVAKTVDGIFGSPIQRIFSFNFPLIGPIGVLDILNYMVHSRGKLVSQNGLLAVVGAKIVQTGGIAGMNIIPVLTNTNKTTVNIAGLSQTGANL